MWILFEYIHPHPKYSNKERPERVEKGITQEELTIDF
jgi:hypothetical protein